MSSSGYNRWYGWRPFIIIFEIDSRYMNADDFVTQLATKGIQIISMGQGKLRMVTHLDYTDHMHHRMLEVLKNLQFREV